jgi:PEGA domain
VFLDRKFVGNAPVVAKDFPPGTHQLNLTAEGYDGYSQPIEVAAGPADVMVKFKEIRLNEAVDVVHKHAMGSCEGRLVADPQGIRYETSNTDDAFTLKFSEIETFQVDYLKKNLRIKKRGGKQYNFTTKAANADPLFVFHRNVDKVRQQVAGTPPVSK